MASLKLKLELNEEECRVIFAAVLRQAINDSRLAETKLELETEEAKDSLLRLHRSGHFAHKIMGELVKVNSAFDLYSSEEIQQELDGLSKRTKKLCDRVEEINKERENQTKEEGEQS